MKALSILLRSILVSGMVILFLVSPLLAATTENVPTPAITGFTQRPIKV